MTKQDVLNWCSEHNRLPNRLKNPDEYLYLERYRQSSSEFKSLIKPFSGINARKVAANKVAVLDFVNKEKRAPRYTEESEKILFHAYRSYTSPSSPQFDPEFRNNITSIIEIKRGGARRTRATIEAKKQRSKK